MSEDYVECLSPNEPAWAADGGANGPGIRSSIYIEICESGDYACTFSRAVELVAEDTEGAQMER